MNIFILPQHKFIITYIFIVLFAINSIIVFRLAIFYLKRSSYCLNELSPIDLALLSGGLSRAADVIALRLLQSGGLFFLTNDRIIVREFFSGIDVIPELDYLRSFGPGISRSKLPKILDPWIKPSWEILSQSGLAISLFEMKIINIFSILIGASVILIGIIRVIIGILNGEVVQYIVVNVVLAAVCISIFSKIKGLATIDGRKLLARYRATNERATRAPLPDKVILAFSIFGPVALIGTALAPYTKITQTEFYGGGDGGCGGD